MPDSDAIAVIGMACIFPGARDLTSFWQNICNGVDAVQAAPPGRLDPAFFAPGLERIDRHGCRRGGFIDEYAYFDPQAHGVMPYTVDTAEPEQLLSLEVSARALRDAGYTRGNVPERTAVIFGRGNYTSRAVTRFEQRVRGAEQIVRALQDLLPQLAPNDLERVRAAFQAGNVAAEREAVVNLVPNLVASRVAERFHLHGPAYTIDAACASSLVAIDHARSLLLERKVDVALAGGVHLAHSEDFWCTFHQLGLLSAAGISRPLDRRADGLLISEGVGVVVLRRLEDARADRIYARLLGTGTSSDGRGTSVLRPNKRGQLLALGEAWRVSGCDPRDVGLLEAHATGTQAGDAVEIETTADFFGAANGARATIGSIKSMLGHAMPAAGVAGFIKVALALHHGVLPPTLHCEQPREELASTRFATRAQPQVWEGRIGARFAALNAFGFGGINAHAVLGAAETRASSRGHGARERRGFPDLARYAQPTPEALIEALKRDRRGGEGGCRAALLFPTEERRAQTARSIQSGRTSHGQNDVFASTSALLGEGRIAFLYPGLDAGPAPAADRLAGWLDTSELEEVGSDLESHGRRILAVNRLVWRALSRIGVEPFFLAGHSIGEWTAMEAAGIADPEQVAALGRLLGPGSFDDGEFCFVAAGCSAERLSELLAGEADALLSHDNCPHQAVFACPAARAPALVHALSARGVLAQVLPFGSGVHTPWFRARIAPHLSRLTGLALKTSTRIVYSATSCAPYPDSPEDIRALLVRHMIEPVRFRGLIERLYAEGARAFVQVGSGRLVNFVSDTLRGRRHLALAAHDRAADDLLQLARVACALWVECGRVRWDALGAADCDDTTAPRGRKLNLGAPLIRLPPFAPAPELAERTPPSSVARDAQLLELVNQNFARMRDVERELRHAIDISALEKPHAAATLAVVSPEPVPTSRQLELSLSAYPELRDHAFYRVPVGWDDTRDRAPIVPMTGMFELFAAGVDRGAALCSLREVWAKRWLDVSEPKRVTVQCVRRSDGLLDTTLGDYAAARVELGGLPRTLPIYEEWPLKNPRPVPISARQLYEERFMFHGPEYQRVVGLRELGDDGITGELEAGGALGSLLDAAGQLLGLWLMLTQVTDRFALPMRVEHVRYFRVLPTRAERCSCAVRITALEPERLVGDIRLGTPTGLWVEIRGWQDYRFATDEALLELSRWPERSLLCETTPTGVRLNRARYSSLKTFEMLASIYVPARERPAFSASEPPLRWSRLCARIAAVDAVRALCCARGEPAGYPIEFAARELTGGRFQVVRGAQTWVVGVEDDQRQVRAAIEPQRPGAANASALGRVIRPNEGRRAP